MYAGQARRYFPMPDYDLSGSHSVKLTLHGAIVDAAYSRALIQHTDLDLSDILALDRVQKKLPIDDVVIQRLRRARLIEGRRPHLFVAANVASATANKAAYIRTRSQDDEFYIKLVLDYLGQFGASKRQEIDALLMTKLSDALNDAQKRNKISNLLSNMRRNGRIRNTGARKAPRWVLMPKMQDKNL
jgi:ATP-dependent DNA helicase RecG